MASNDQISHAGSRTHRLIVLLVSAITLTACQKAETVPTTSERLKYVEKRQQTEPDFNVPRKVVDYMSDLKSIKDNSPRPVAVVAAPPSSPNAVEPKEVKTIVNDARVAAPVAAAPAGSGTSAAPTPGAPVANVIASAQPTARPQPPKESPASVIVLSREQPQFPQEVLRAGIESGTVRAKLTINASGDVSDVTIIEARPVRVFDRAVKQALSRWKFNPGTDGRTYDTLIDFHP